MKIDHLILGLYETNCYILRATEADKNCLIIDTGLQASKLIDFLKDNHLKPLAVVLTHGHADHITGVELLRENFPDIKVYIHKLDADMLTGKSDNLSEITGQPFKTGPSDITVDEFDIVDIAGIKLQVLHTPGHTPGGICLYAKEDNLVFVGDTLFADSMGRTDLPGGSMTKLIDSIKEKLFSLPDDTVCYPGHGPKTTIEREKKYNPFLK